MLSCNLWRAIGTATVTVIVANLVFTKILLADENTQTTTLTTTFSCGMNQQGKPATITHAPRGDVPIILWVSKYFKKKGFDPQVRCQIVSARFQALYSTGNFNYIVPGTVNHLPAICATKREEDSCTKDNILFTLEPNDDPLNLIKQLKGIRADAAGPITRGEPAIEVEDLGTTINLENFLDNAPIQPKDSTIPTTTAPTSTNPPTQPAPSGLLW